MSQLDDFASENSLGAGALKNVFKSLLSIPNSMLRFLSNIFFHFYQLFHPRLPNLANKDGQRNQQGTKIPLDRSLLRMKSSKDE